MASRRAVVWSFARCRCRRVRADFSGGSVSSNGGALLLREVDRKWGLTARVARAIGGGRQRAKVRHEVVAMLCQRVHAVALGYEDLNDHDALRHDEVWCTRRVSETNRWPVPRRYAGSSAGPSGSGRRRFTRPWWSSSSPRTGARRASWCSCNVRAKQVLVRVPWTEDRRSVSAGSNTAPPETQLRSPVWPDR